MYFLKGLYKSLKIDENYIKFLATLQGVRIVHTKKNKAQISSKIMISATALLLAACQDQGPKTSHMAGQEEQDLTLAQILKVEHKTSEDRQIALGMKAMLKGELQLASKTFNSLLIDDPLNAQVHALNALTYHLMSKNGDVAKETLAQAGFEQVLKIDPCNTLASLQLGRIAAARKDYVKAQEFFSNVLLLDSKHMDAQFELATASYHLGDLKTAAMSIDRVMTAQPDEARNIRAAALIYAALGRKEQAQIYLAKYSTLPIGKRHKKYLERRVQDWEDLHNSGRLVAQADTAPAAGSETAPAPAETTAAEPAAEIAPEPVAPAPAPTVTPVAEAPKAEQENQVIIKDFQEDMIVVDAVIMRVSEAGKTFKGNNIMETFTMSLSPFNYFRARNTSGPIAAGAPIFPTNNSSTSSNTSLGGAADAGEALKGGTASLITQGISFGTLNYSLNIANSSDEVVEIIGRPTLTATVGKAADFFSGTNKHIALAGQFGGNITETPIGTELIVTPVEYKDGFITLDVELRGSSITQVVGSIIADNSTAVEFDILKDHVKTTVKVKAGETIMLAGITQRELKTSKQGFPILQNIPVIQYLFSEEISLSDRKSVMYLLTPRSYSRTITETKRFFAKGEEYGKRPRLDELETRHKDWYDPSINNTLILQHLAPVYDEFRTGDLHEIKWGHDDDVAKQLTSIANFLWY